MTNPSPENDALALAILEHLGPSALAGDKMTPLHAFELGWQAAKDSPIPTQVEAESVDSDYRLQELLENFHAQPQNSEEEFEAEKKLIAHIASLVAAARQEGRQDGRKARDVAAGIATGLIEHYKARAEKAEAALAASQAAPEKYKLTDADRAALADASTAGLSVARLPDAGIAFINRGHDYGYNGLECEACGGSGRIEDFSAWKSSQAAPAKAEGWQIVPIEPTPEMAAAFAGELDGACGSFFDWERGGNEAYRAMLAAAPSDQWRRDQQQRLDRMQLQRDASHRSMILGQAVAHYNCQWPLDNEPMYFNGQRFTPEEFNERVAAVMRARG